MAQAPTHHRAAALVLAVFAVLALAHRTPPRTVPLPPAPPPVDAGPLRVDPQTATAREIEALPGIGPAIARRIVEARASGVVFRRAADLRRVRGVGPRTLERIAPFLVFTGR